MIGYSTASLGPGYDRRWRKIFNSATGRTLILPLDHGATIGPVPGLDDLNALSAVFPKVDALMVRPAMLRRMNGPAVDSCGLILCLTGRLVRGVDHVALNSVEEAVRAGADAIAVELKLGSHGELLNAAIASKLIEEAHLLGLPTLATIYAQSAYVAEVGAFAHAHACRVAEELGADMVKTKLPTTFEEITACVESVKIPIIQAGGSLEDAGTLEQRLATAHRAGVAGAAIGRALWGDEDVLCAADRFSKQVHGE